VLATAGFAAAEEGVVRISDSATRPGVVRMGANHRPAIQRTAYGAPAYGHPAAAQQHYQAAMNQYAGGNPYYGATAGHSGMQGYSVYQPTAYSSASHGHCGCGDGGCTDGCGVEGCGSGGCGMEGCGSGNCRGGRGNRGGSCQNGNYFPKGREGRKLRKECENGVCYGDGYNQRMATLFARATPDDGCTRWPTRWWRGQQQNYLARNQRLSNTLFGWLVPSGCCGQGCAPVGCYSNTYAADPGYTDHRDGGQQYGVQGYGIPLTVPLAPNVRHSYNYSWGMPASRITPIGHNGGTAMGQGQPSPYQSW